MAPFLAPSPNVMVLARQTEGRGSDFTHQDQVRCVHQRTARRGHARIDRLGILTEAGWNISTWALGSYGRSPEPRLHHVKGLISRHGPCVVEPEKESSMRGSVSSWRLGRAHAHRVSDVYVVISRRPVAEHDVRRDRAPTGIHRVS